MANGNNISLVGNLTRTVELRYTPAGKAVGTFGLAVNRRWQSDGEWQEATSFFDVVCWGDLGEHVAESVDKGARVMVQGRLEQRTWENQEGEKRSRVEVIADEVGPSLRWATAEVTKIERQGGGYGYQSNDEPPASAYDDGPAPARSGGGGRVQAPPAYDYGDEEPFLLDPTLDYHADGWRAVSKWS